MPLRVLSTCFLRVRLVFTHGKKSQKYDLSLIIKINAYSKGDI